MVTYAKYLKGILEKIIESHGVLSGLNDAPEDLDTMSLELVKIRGFLLVISNKVDASRYPSIDIKRLQAKSRSYLDTYDFEREIGNLGSLYANDSNRLKNMRLLILESLNDKKLMEDIADAARIL